MVQGSRERREEMTRRRPPMRWALYAALGIMAGCSGASDGYYGGPSSAAGGGAHACCNAAPGPQGSTAGGSATTAGGTGSIAHESPFPPPVDPAPQSVAINPFVDVAHDPFSTFAADVDTASYDLFRANARRGALPSPQQVRVEEYVNAFTYDDPAPEWGAEVPFRVTLEAAPHPLGRDTTLLRIGIRAADAPEAAKLPTNLVFLVDVSGSMSAPEKLPVVQAMMRAALDELDATDTISIVTYAGSTRVALTPTPATERSTILQAIDALQSGGGTAGAAGIELAYAQAEAGFIEGGLNHVFLCTDGDFNIGISSTDALVDFIEEKRESGVTLTALGVGAYPNDAMMELVSNAGNGIYSILIDGDDAERYAREDLFRTAVHVARDMKLQLELNPAFVSAYRLLGYENREIADDDFRDDDVDAGEVGAGFQVTALYELVLTDGVVPEPEGAPPRDTGEAVEGEREIAAEELAQLRIRYRLPEDGFEAPAHELFVSLLPEDVAEDAPADDSTLAFTAAVASLAERLRDSPFADGDAIETLTRIINLHAPYDDDRAALHEAFTAIVRQL